MTAETPQERKARLEALRLAAELSTAPDTENALGESRAAASPDDDQEKEAEREEPGYLFSMFRMLISGDNGDREPVIRFRNYVPRDESLQELKVAPPQTVKFEDPVANVPVDVNGVEEPIVSIAPKKANWDLRRDVAKKLTKLERRTQRALIQLMQEEEKRRQDASIAAEEAEDEIN